jgi:hypothetical protein
VHFNGIFVLCLLCLLVFLHKCTCLVKVDDAQRDAQPRGVESLVKKQRKRSVISSLAPWKLGACRSFVAYQMQACRTFYTQRTSGLKISNVTFNVEIE